MKDESSVPPTSPELPGAFPSLANQCLVAMPGMQDPHFAGAVVYICEHNEKGALGLVINKATNITLENLFDRIELALEIEPYKTRRVLLGGPVQGDRGFVLHSLKEKFSSSLPINEHWALTTSKDVLEAVAQGKGPEKWLITLGYAGWSEGQLEAEIAENAWLNVPANEQLLFELPLEERFAAAFAQLGIDPVRLTRFAGHA